MLGLGWTGAWVKLGAWVLLAGGLAGLFVALIFIRITVPRFRVEALSRLGWATLLALVGLVWAVYGLGLLLG